MRTYIRYREVMGDMRKTLEKYAGQAVVIIYADRRHRMTKRRVRLLAVEEDRIQAFCLEKGAPRTFLTASVLAAEPLGKAGKTAFTFGA
ncbi:hypothetical protein [Paenibacillus sp.]|uniref:hypothetical protein n=1 Tax=Paenibacillus sp. TaxID=58172 RepID=UPI002D623377|nr:hypothetical protein [Paenibacillus sp.]HZG55312.1 hypothetical protein [Paenibacillus sp.]